jgi:hypothetical protein
MSDEPKQVSIEEKTKEKNDDELESEELDLVSGGLAIATPIRQLCPPVCITSTS